LTLLTRDEFARRIARHPLLLDGAMGTMLYERGLFLNRCFDEVSISQPEIVSDIHLQYVKAGAELIETNTFGANGLKLKGYGLDSKTFDINAAGARLAKEAAGDKALVAGAIGPLGLLNIPKQERPGLPEMEAYYEEQVKGLLAGGVDLFLLETHYSIDEIEAVVNAIRRQAADVAIIAHVSVYENGYTDDHVSVTEAIERMSALATDAVGINCNLGPRQLMDPIRQGLAVATKPFSAMPNAGAPTQIDGRYLYLTTPEYIATYAQRYVELGVRLVGGCCGTSPEHIRQMRNFMLSRAAGRVEISSASEQADREKPDPKPAVETSRKSCFAYKLLHGEKYVTSVEVSPPSGADLKDVVKKIKLLQSAGVDVINIPDGPRAVSRMTPVALASYLERVVGMESVLHYTCRDRNLLGMQADFMGMNALGIHNVLIITGDPPKMGDYPHATGVFDVDSIGLAKILNNLNHSLDLGGRELKSAPVLHYGVGCEPGATNQEREVRRLHEKLAAGAEFIMTQPVYDVRILESFLSRVDVGKTPILVGILPLASHRNAQFLHYEVPGMSIPDPIRERMRVVGSGPVAQAEGVRIAQEAIEASKDLTNVRGFYIMPPLGRYHLALEVLKPIGIGNYMPNYDI
jgi:homocysteine S-methyltransferase